MKLMVLFTLLFSTFAQAGNEMGNGGGLVYCPHYNKYYFYDAYAMKILRSWDIVPPGNLNDELTIAEGFAGRLKSIDPKLVMQLKGWIRSFYSETEFVDGDQLSVTSDFYLKVLMSEDVLEQVIIQNLPSSARYTISRSRWNMLNKIQKGVAVFHEVIYRRALLRNPDLKKSDAVIQLVQLVISNKGQNSLFADRLRFFADLMLMKGEIPLYYQEVNASDESSIRYLDGDHRRHD